MYQKKYAIGVLSNRFDIGRTLKELRRVGFTADQITITARNIKFDEQLNLAELDPDGDMNTTGVLSGAIVGGLLGAVFGGMAGVGWLFTSGMLWMAMETIATTVGITLASAGVGATCGGVITSVADSNSTSYSKPASEPRYQRHEFLVIVNGAASEIKIAESIMNQLCSGKVLIY
jgi:hypothetical protein